MSTMFRPADLITYPGERFAVSGPTPPGQRKDRERLAVLEAQIAQTCYELSRLRAEHRRIRGHLALLEAADQASSSTPANPD